MKQYIAASSKKNYQEKPAGNSSMDPTAISSSKNLFRRKPPGFKEPYRRYVAQPHIVFLISHDTEKIELFFQ